MIYTAFISLLLLIGAAMAAENGTFFYNAQGDWGGICVTGNDMRQSPIDIVTANVEEDDDLIPLGLSDAWATAYSGEFLNSNGFTAQFNPANDPPAPTFSNHIGTYNLRNVHFHWGTETGEGTELR